MNMMNSVAIVESPAQGMQHYYLVSLHTNLLRKDAALLHRALATRLHELIEAHKADNDQQMEKGKDGEL
jgi:hypothetical protein